MHIIETRPRQGRWNMLGTWTLYQKEVRRFFKIAAQTFVAPVITALLFLAIFNLAFSGEGRSIGNVPFIQFLVPGLTLMAMMTAAFANASFSLMFEKVVETIVDTLMPPMSPGELAAGYILSSTTRGLLVGITVLLGMVIFTTVQVHSWFFVLFYAVAASMLMSVLGLITAIWAEKIDHVASINNFIIMPLTFLSGTFYSTQHLPEIFQQIAHFNPFFYMIDGFRYGFLGQHDGDLTTGIVLLIVMIAISWLACVKLFASGYKLKS
jgi:ABC-2 type transport system permease protein